MKSPIECRNMGDIRAEIDSIDSRIVELIAERYDYVKAAALFKTDQAAVRAPERFKAMLQQRREWAAARGLDPDVIEKMYRDLVDYFIREELAHWENRQADQTTS